MPILRSQVHWESLYSWRTEGGNIMAYTCQKCSQEVKPEQVKFRVICPYCSSRVLAKQRSAEAKPTLAR